jgi:hypothetical protein
VTVVLPWPVIGDAPGVQGARRCDFGAARAVCIGQGGDKCASFASTSNPVDSTAVCHALLVQYADSTPLRFAL